MTHPVSKQVSMLSTRIDYKRKADIALIGCKLASYIFDKVKVNGVGGFKSVMPRNIAHFIYFVTQNYSFYAARAAAFNSRTTNALEEPVQRMSQAHKRENVPGT